MKRSVKIRVLCLIVAAVVLGGAVTAAAIMGSPYETAKRAVLDAMTYRNATTELEITATINGKVFESEKTFTICGDNNSLSNYYNDNGDLSSYSYCSDSLNISLGQYISVDGEWYNASLYPNDNYMMYNRGAFAFFSVEDRDSAQMRFIELLIDTLVGDLKNNITMTTDNGVRYISGTLTSSQVPELVKAGIDVLIEQSGNYYGYQNKVSFNGTEYVYEQISIENKMKTTYIYKQTVQKLTDEEREAWESGMGWDLLRDKLDKWWTTYIDEECYFVTDEVLVSTNSEPATRSDYRINNDNPFDMPMKSLVINYVRGDAQVDSDGNLTFLEVSGAATLTDIFGEVNEIDIKATLKLSDIGTSNPVCPIPGAEQVLAYDKMKERFGVDYGYIYLYFKLNADGTIDEDSITTMYPGERPLGIPIVIDKSAVDVYPYDDPVPVPAPVPVPDPDPVPVPDDVDHADPVDPVDPDEDI